MEKVCTRCGESKTLDAFNRARRSKDRLQFWCRECERAYRAENRERISERDRTGYRAKRFRRYYAANREKVKAYSRAYHRRNREEVLRKMRIRGRARRTDKRATLVAT